MRRLSPLPLTLFVAASLLLLGLLAALDGSPTTWANPLDDTPTPTATTDTPSATETVTATATVTATVATTPTATMTATAVTPGPTVLAFLPFIEQRGNGYWEGSDYPSQDEWFDRAVKRMVMLSPTDGWRVGGGEAQCGFKCWGSWGFLSHWDGPTWSYVRTYRCDLKDVSFTSPTSGWAVGWRLWDTSPSTDNDEPCALRWNGAQWEPAPAPGGTKAVAMLSSADGWALGENDIYRWNGATWTKFQEWTQPPGTISLARVEMVAPSDGWIVGSRSEGRQVHALALHWDGHTWMSSDISMAGRLLALDALAPNDVWAVGDKPIGGGRYPASLIAHWDGHTWTEISAPQPDVITASLEDISMTSPTNGWAVGALFNNVDTVPFYPSQGIRSSESLVLHWDGQTWSIVEVFRHVEHQIGTTVTMTSPTHVWVNGYPTMRRYTYRAVPAPTPTPIIIPPRVLSYWLRAVTLTSATDGWAVGEDGVLLHWNGQRWTGVTVPTFTYLNALAALSPTSAWAAGLNAMLHWDGISWQPTVPEPPVSMEQLFTLAMVSDTDGWAGGFTLWRWDGSKWRPYSDSPVQVHGIAMLSPSDGWLLAEDPLTYKSLAMRWNGVQWIRTPWETDDVLLSIVAVSPTDVWAVGRNTDYPVHGVIYHWNGTGWRQVPAPTDSWSYTAAHFLSASDGWVVGSGGAILHWDGDSWQSVVSPTQADLYGISMISPSDGWIVGDAGATLHWDGHTWQQVPLLLLTSDRPTPTP